MVAAKAKPAKPEDSHLFIAGFDFIQFIFQGLTVRMIR
jgi:hypothetical protein